MSDKIYIFKGGNIGSELKETIKELLYAISGKRLEDRLKKYKQVMETKHKEFKAFDKVLVKATFENNYEYEGWSYDLYSHWDSNTNSHICIGSSVIPDKDILPYEGNEHLVGTTDEPEEEVKLEEGELIIVFDVHERFFDNISCVRKFKGTLNSVFETNASNWCFAIRFSDFNPNDMEETKKHILCVKNGKIVKYKG